MVAVHLTDGGIDVDGQRAVAGSGTRRPRPGEDLAGHLVELPDMPEGEAAQPRPHRGGRHHPVAEHAGGRPCPQQLHVVDAVSAHGQRVHQRQQLASGASRAGPLAEIDQLVGGPLNPQPLGKGRGQQQPSAGDCPGVIERDIDLVQDDVGGSHRKGASYWGRMAGLAAAILPGQEALFTIQTGSTHHRNGGSRLSSWCRLPDACRGPWADRLGDATSCRCVVVVSNPQKTRAVAEAKVKTDKVDAAVLAGLLAADYLPAVWLPMRPPSRCAARSPAAPTSCGSGPGCRNQVQSILHRNPAGGVRRNTDQVQPCTTRGGRRVPPPAGRQRPAPLLWCSGGLAARERQWSGVTCWNCKA